MTDKRRDYSTLAAVIIAVVSFLVTAYASYAHNDKDITSRVVAVEVKQTNDHDAIIRIEAKQDKTNDKLDRLVEWALGGK